MQNAYLKHIPHRAAESALIHALHTTLCKKHGFFLIILGLVICLNSYAQTTIQGINVSSSVAKSADSVSIIADGIFRYQTHRLAANPSKNKPPRFVVNALGVKTRIPKFDREVNGNFIQRIRTGQHKNHFSIVFDLTDAAPSASLSLQTSREGQQLAIYFGPTQLQNTLDDETFKGPALAPAILKRASKTVVVIDPGHGGRDPGAVSFDIQEKNITLAIAKRLRNILQKDSNFTVHMTRDTDVKVKLVERVRLANALRADLFISIHADAILNPNIQGASVYTLSEKSSDKLAQALAENANSVDGFDLNLERFPPDLRKALSEVQMQAKQGNSLRLANILHNKLKGVDKMVFKRPHSANFAVLRSDIAAVLVEVGFLTNQTDAARLSRPINQQRIAVALYDGIKGFRQFIPPRRKAEGTEYNDNVKNHRVVIGDTLYSIARRYKVTVKSLRRYNNLRTNILVIGQEIKIPPASN